MKHLFKVKDSGGLKGVAEQLLLVTVKEATWTDDFHIALQPSMYKRSFFNLLCKCRVTYWMTLHEAAKLVVYALLRWPFSCQ